jgi:gliding motility-associated-like protein
MINLSLMSRYSTIIILLVSTIVSTSAQITSNAFYTEQTQYGGGAIEDPIFFYDNISAASLTAPSGVEYQWFQYSTSSNTFEIMPGETGSFLNITEENGYQVKVEDVTGTTTDYYCWNFVPLLSISSIETTPDQSACRELRLTVNMVKPLIYYNHHRTDTPSREVDYGYSWSSSPIGPIEGETDKSVRITAPLENTDYFVTIGSKFSPTLTPVDEDLTYTSVAVEAKYSFETEGTADNEATEGSAPMVVRFTDESLGNISDWEWTFGDAGKDFIPDPTFTFQKYNEDGYPVVLKVTNLNSGCSNESNPEVFTVNEMIVSAPNAFTPFSSIGQNDEFKVAYRSVKKFTMLIYNRWGRKVFQTNDPAKGWDGRIGNQRAEAGVYFFKIEATGFKGEKLDLDGVVHLIIKNN